ncbi:MAG: hypothetical protein ABI725_06610 [Chloroflexota bacterium]
MNRPILAASVALSILVGCSSAAPTPAPTAAPTPTPTLAPTASPAPLPTPLARGTFIFPWDQRTVEIDAAGTGSGVVGTMTVSNAATSFTVDLQCTRTTEDGLVVIGGDVTASTLTDYAPEGTRTAIIFQRGSPVQAIFWFQETDPRAASCLAFIEEVSVRADDSEMQAIRGSVELAP